MGPIPLLTSWITKRRSSPYVCCRCCHLCGPRHCSVSALVPVKQKHQSHCCRGNPSRPPCLLASLIGRISPSRRDPWQKTRKEGILIQLSAPGSRWDEDVSEPGRPHDLRRGVRFTRTAEVVKWAHAGEVKEHLWGKESTFSAKTLVSEQKNKIAESSFRTPNVSKNVLKSLNDYQKMFPEEEDSKCLPPLCGVEHFL